MYIRDLNQSFKDLVFQRQNDAGNAGNEFINLSTPASDGGFVWAHTPEGGFFWNLVNLGRYIDALHSVKNTIKLEFGRRYVRRDGVITGKIVKSNLCDNGEIDEYLDEDSSLHYYPNGRRWLDREDNLDLITEFVEEKTVEESPEQKELKPTVEVRRFPSGSIRSSDRGRLRPDYISPYALEEIAEHFTKAEKDFGSEEDATNYFKGIRPIDVKGSISRHYLDLQKAFYPYDSAKIREELRALACNCIMALHQISIEEKGLYTEPFDKTEYIQKEI